MTYKDAELKAKYEQWQMGQALNADAASAGIGLPMEGCARLETPQEQVERRAAGLQRDHDRLARFHELLLKHPEFPELLELIRINEQLGII
jgi:hypothetical protein